MRDSPWYIAFLAVVIGGIAGYVYLGSEVRVLEVTGKYSSDGRTRYGMTNKKFVVETRQGSLHILKFPLLGYTFGAEDAYKSVVAGTQITARVGIWPPSFISQNAKPHIMAIY